MSKGYVIGNIDVHSPEAYKGYVAKAPATVEQFGGTYLVRGGEQDVVEGEPPLPRTVVLEFPSLEAAKTWYNSPEYQAIVSLRHEASTGNMYFVEGK